MAKPEKIPVVTVCVITYNHEQYIRQCLQSIVDQETDFDFEVIVGEDCSTDGTKAIVQEFSARYPGKIFPIYHTENIGAGVHNYLTVHNAANGAYVAHVDGDDYWLPGKLQRQKDFLDENTSFSAVWHKVCVDNTRSNKLSVTGDMRAVFSEGIITLNKLLRYGMAGVHSSLMYRKAGRVTKAPKFDVLDLFYSLELLESGNGMLLDETLGTYRVLSGAISSTKTLKVRALCAHHIYYFFRRHPHLRKDVFIFAVTNLLIDLKHGRKSALAFLRLALKSATRVGPYEFFSHVKSVMDFR